MFSMMFTSVAENVWNLRNEKNCLHELLNVISQYEQTTIGFSLWVSSSFITLVEVGIIKT